MSPLDRLVEAGLVGSRIPLAPITTYKLGGPARWFCEVDGPPVLDALSAALAEPGSPEVLVMGRGSNLVVSDRGFPGLVVRLSATYGEVRCEEDGTVVAGGATPLPALARTAARAGRGGLEFFVGIPGSVGGAVRMNAGCHGSETAEWLAVARVVDLATGALEERDPDRLDLAYRHSSLARTDLVLEARFHTKPTSPEEAGRAIRAVTRWRRDHQPGGTLNAGSVFRNPPGEAAGRIIDRLGLKGFRGGGASVSQKHANFFVASPEASAQDVYELVWAVRRRVGEETGTWLVPEIQFAGPFRPSPDQAAGPPGEGG